MQILEHNWMLPGFVSGFWNKGKKGGTIQMPSKPKWGFSFMGKKMKKSATLKLLAFRDFTADHQIFKVQYFRQWQYSQSVCQRASKFRPESRKIDPQVGMNRHSGGYKWVIDQNWGRMDFLAKNWDFGLKKKRSLFRIHHVLAGEWPERAKNRGEPRKMTPSSVKEFFLGWSEWENCSPGYTGEMPHWQESRSL